MAEPGGDDEKKEGKIDEQSSIFADYRCVFRAAGDSLYMMMKNVKTKRSFHNTFSKKMLNEMELKQSIDKVINLLNEAKSGTKSELAFKIAFGDANNDKNVSFDKLSKDYSTGNALFIFVAIEHSYFTAKYVFKLLEQKRNETDILRDIIADMQDEIDQLKLLTQSQTGIAVWKISKNTNGNIPLDIEHVAPTLKGMVKLSDDKKKVIIGIPGVYRISVHLSYSSYSEGCTADRFEIRLNGDIVEQRYAVRKGGFGTTDTVFKLKKNDEIVFYCNCMHVTSAKWNSFSIQKL
eukprot:246062_1